MNFTGYESNGYFDEMIGEDGKPRAAARPLAKDIESLPEGELELRQQAAEHALIQAGITFNVYSDSQGVEKTLPFDLIPRIMGGTEWKRMDRGLKQRITKKLFPEVFSAARVRPVSNYPHKLPVNSYEAESRRLARFFRLGRTPGPLTVAPAQPHPDSPFTLDLRHN